MFGSKPDFEMSGPNKGMAKDNDENESTNGFACLHLVLK